MSNAHHPHHSRKHAKTSRRKCGPGRTPRGRWTRPLRRLKRVIASSQRLIDDARRVLKTSKQLARVRPIRTWLDFERASRGLVVANARLERALVPLFRQIGGGTIPAPRTVWATRARWFTATTQLEHIAAQLDARNAQLLDSILSGEVRLERLTPTVTAPVRRLRIHPKPRTDTVRWFLIVRLASARDRIASVPVKRPRLATIPAEDAPRQISRGRAPPSASSLL